MGWGTGAAEDGLIPVLIGPKLALSGLKGVCFGRAGEGNKAVVAAFDAFHERLFGTVLDNPDFTPCTVMPEAYAA